MKEIHVLVTGSCSDTSNRAAFTSKEECERIAELVEGYCDTIPINDFSVADPPRGKCFYQGWFKRKGDGTIKLAHINEGSLLNEDGTIWREYVAPTDFRYGTSSFGVYAKSEEHAIEKVREVHRGVKAGTIIPVDGEVTL